MTTTIDQQQPMSTEQPTKAHPLENAWTLWFHNPAKKTNSNNYFSYLNKVYKFHTVEQFWGLYNHIMTPSKLGIGCTYYMFKEDIRPEWESTECCSGGEWLFTLTPKQREEMDQYWLNAVLACIGEFYDDDVSEAVCGCCVAIRKAQLRISLWIASCDEHVAKKLGEQFRNAVLQLESTATTTTTTTTTTLATDGDGSSTGEEKKQSEPIQFQFKSFSSQLKGIRDPQYSIP